MKGEIYIYQAEDEIFIYMYASRVLGGRPVGVHMAQGGWNSAGTGHVWALRLEVACVCLCFILNQHRFVKKKKA